MSSETRQAEAAEAAAALQARGELRDPPPNHPMHHIAVTLRAAITRLSRRLEVPADGRVLDHGCADMPYRSLFPEGVEFTGADLPGNPLAGVEIGEDGSLPLDDASFDAVLSTQVLEHVGDPAAHLAESFRVLEPGGRMLLSTHGIMIYHPDPLDLWRWTSAGLRRIVEREGFEVEHFEGIMGLAPTGLQLFQDSVYYRLRRPGMRNAFAGVMQRAIAAADRAEPRGSARDNALVFALIARKP